jgi:hypothetical protein
VTVLLVASRWRRRPPSRSAAGREDATRLDVPVYLVEGRHEAAGRAVLANERFEQLEAPSEKPIVLNTSGHRPLWEQPGQLLEVMTETVLVETDPDQDERTTSQTQRKLIRPCGVRPRPFWGQVLGTGSSFLRETQDPSRKECARQMN